MFVTLTEYRLVINSTAIWLQDFCSWIVDCTHLYVVVNNVIIRSSVLENTAYKIFLVGFSTRKKLGVLIRGSWVVTTTCIFVKSEVLSTGKN